MWGAIIGDMAGSIYEFTQIKKISPVQVETLIQKESYFSDDTILTIAILDAILHNQDYGFYLRKYGKAFKNYKPEYETFLGPFSPNFMKWVDSDEIGNNIGNGAMMRISSVGYMFNTEEEVRENAKKATIPSHNSQEAIECATTIALIIFYARKGYSKEQIIDQLQLSFEYTPFQEFNGTCYKTIDNCLYAVFHSNNYEEAVKKVLSYGGDTDTNACIVGAMAEALYGVDDELIALAKQKLPQEFIEILEQGYSKTKKIYKKARF